MAAFAAVPEVVEGIVFEATAEAVVGLDSAAGSFVVAAVLLVSFLLLPD